MTGEPQALSMWVIYAKPLDAPDSFVARRWDMARGDRDFSPASACHVAPSLELVRAMLPEGLYRIDRSAGDEPHIVETWL